MKYQDTWINRKCVEKGNRNCEDRYEIIKQFCQKNFTSSFNVCDIGANMAYFDIRLIEDFDCRVMAFEFHQYEKRKKIIEQNNIDDKLMYVNRKLKIEDLQVMKKFCRFDLTLALSVLHHVTEPIRMWLHEMKKMSEYVIVEFAGDDSDLPAKRTNYKIPEGGEIIGYGDSHLDKNFKRPIVAYKGVSLL